MTFTKCQKVNMILYIMLIKSIKGDFMGFLEKLIGTDEYDKNDIAIEEINRNIIDENIKEIEKMRNSDFFKSICGEIQNKNKNGLVSYDVKGLHQEVEKICSQKNNVKPFVNLLPVSSVKIETTHIMLAGDKVYYSTLGYKQLTENQADVLGMSLVKYGHFAIPKDIKNYFRCLYADDKYWCPVVENIINEIYSKKDI